MASKYAVATGNWDSLDTTCWSNTDGGAAGAAAPTSNDDVFFTALTGAKTITVLAGAVAGSITCTGSGYTLAGSAAMSVGNSSAGQYVLTSGMTYSYSGILTLVSTSDNAGAGWNVTTASKIMPSFIMNGAGGRWKFTDGFSHGGATTRVFTLTTGTLDLNGQTFMIGLANWNGAGVRAIIPNGAIVNITGVGTAFNLSTTSNLTMDASTLTVNMTQTGASAKTFAGGGKTYLSLTLPNSVTSETISGSNSFGNLSGTNLKTIILTAGTTQTILPGGTLNMSGTSQNNLYLQSSSGGSTATISAPVNATVSFTYAQFTDIIASGGADFKAITSRNASNSTGFNYMRALASTRTVATTRIVAAE